MLSSWQPRVTITPLLNFKGSCLEVLIPEGRVLLPRVTTNNPLNWKLRLPPGGNRKLNFFPSEALRLIVNRSMAGESNECMHVALNLF